MCVLEISMYVNIIKNKNGDYEISEIYLEEEKRWVDADLISYKFGEIGKSVYQKGGRL